MVGEILRAMGRLEECPEGEENDGTFVEYQIKVLHQCEAIARVAHDMVHTLVYICTSVHESACS